MRATVILLVAALLSGCLARTAVGVATLPVRAVGAVGDAVTTSQAEADRNRGRRARQAEERQRREDRRRAREERREEERGEAPSPDAR